jgi:hypothetical protein
MSVPTNKEIAQTVRDFMKYLADEMGWLSDGPLVLDHLEIAAKRLEIRGKVTEAMVERAVNEIRKITAFPVEHCRKISRAALKSAMETPTDV